MNEAVDKSLLWIVISAYITNKNFQLSNNRKEDNSVTLLLLLPSIPLFVEVYHVVAKSSTVYIRSTYTVAVLTSFYCIITTFTVLTSHNKVPMLWYY